MIALALSEREGPLAQPRAIAEGFLTLIRRLGEERQVLIAVDDAQWLDADSAVALGFAARRLGEEPVALLVSWRTPQAAPAPLQLDRSFAERLIRGSGRPGQHGRPATNRRSTARGRWAICAQRISVVNT